MSAGMGTCPGRNLRIRIGGGVLAGAAAATLLVSLGGVAVSSGACAPSPATMYLDGFPREASSRPFYYARESDSSMPFLVRRGGHDCSGQAATVRYSSVDATARAGSDYMPVAGRAVLNDPHVRPPSSKEVDVRILNDGRVETGVKKATIRLSRPRGARLGAPHNAPLYIVDDDAAEPRISFGERAYRQRQGSSLAVPVFRSGDGARSASIRYVVRRARSGLLVARGRLVFGPGEHVKVVTFSLQKSAAGGRATVRITLRGSQVVRPSAARVTVAGSDRAPPSSRFHHPKNGRRYGHNDYRVREIHVFTDDRGGSKVVRAQLALRKRRTNGSCSWWNGHRFRRGSCSGKRWLRMRVYEPGFFYYYRIGTLKPSIGTRVAHYTAFARAVDGAGNKEDAMERGRNANTFEIGRR